MHYVLFAKVRLVNIQQDPSLVKMPANNGVIAVLRMASPIHQFNLVIFSLDPLSILLRVMGEKEQITCL